MESPPGEDAVKPVEMTTKDRWMDGWIHRLVHRYIDGRKGGWMDR